jgi:hypothetical protein
MDLEVFIDEPWQHIIRALRRQEGRTVAAIAYVTKRLLDLRRGDILVCDASEHSVGLGQTDPKVLLGYLKKGVSIWSQPGLHAKAIARGQVAVVGSANSSNASADGNLMEFVAMVSRRSAAAAVRERIETIARRSISLDPVTLGRLAKKFRPSKEFRPVRRRYAGKKSETKSRAWCIGTDYIDEHPDIERARQRGTKLATKTAQSLLGKRWRQSYTIDDDLSWSSQQAGRFELGDNIFEVLENKTLKPPGILVHFEPSETRHRSVLFICRDKRLRARRLKNLQGRMGQAMVRLLRRADMRQLSAEELDRMNQIFS